MARAKMKIGRQALLWCCLVMCAGLLLLPVVRAQYPSESQVRKDGTALLLEDYADPPLSSLMGDHAYPPPVNFKGQLARMNSLRSEPANAPGAASRLFVVDMNGILYILDKNTKKFSPYIKFPEIFPRFNTDPGYGAGLVSIAFDPEYAKNGKFYTVHTESPNKNAPVAPTSAHTPTLNLNGYTTTAAVNPPAGSVNYESVLVEWTDTNIKDATFQGTAREILRIGFNFAIHQMGDLLFDPLAKPGQPDYRNLYISVGDGAAGETPGATHTIPQQLNALQGKILRITPDLNLRPNDELSPNGRYRIPSTGPDPNPFAAVSGARGEIYAYGLRNPHRITWDPVSNTLLTNDIGLHSWEEVDIIHKGQNYGYAEREGNEQLFVTPEVHGKTGGQVNPTVAFPATDLLTVAGLPDPVIPLYPVAVYSHQDGDSIGSGFVYRGKLMPQFQGKYIFTDLATGRIFYTDLTEMIASRGLRDKAAPIHEIQVIYRDPHSSSSQPEKRRMYDIVAEAFARKGGIPSIEGGVLPGWAPATGGGRGKITSEGTVDPYGERYAGGRADVRLSMDGDGEIYVLSKSDGMIRRLDSVVTPPPASKQTAVR
jgi:Glucose / Sorbosone dehydrogenase